MAQGVPSYILRSNRIDQCAERVEAIAHDGRVLSGCSLNFLLDSKGLSHSTGSIPSSPDHSCEITVFRMIPCLRPKSLTDSQHGFQLLCLLLSISKWIVCDKACIQAFFASAGENFTCGKPAISQ